MVKSNLMIPFILRNVNVQLFRRCCSVLSDEGVQLETARVFNSTAVFNMEALKAEISTIKGIGEQRRNEILKVIQRHFCPSENTIE